MLDKRGKTRLHPVAAVPGSLVAFDTFAHSVLVARHGAGSLCRFITLAGYTTRTVQRVLLRTTAIAVFAAAFIFLAPVYSIFPVLLRAFRA